MITGYDTVFITGVRVDDAIRAMLDDLHRRWPAMVVALTGTSHEGFAAWDSARQMPVGTGDVLVARDPQMERRWDDVGYRLMEGDEGPFAVLYEPVVPPLVEIQFNEDPYGRGDFTFDPYSATMVAAGLSLVTVVTPDADSPFSRRILDGLGQALIHRGSSTGNAAATLLRGAGEAGER